MFNLIKYITVDLLKNWIVVLFTAFLLVTTLGFFVLEGQSDKATIGLLNLGLLVLPMMTVIFSSIYYYNMYEFMLLILAQPLRRKQVVSSIFVSLFIVFFLCISIGIGIPLLVLSPSVISAMLFLVFVLLELIFIAIALWASVLSGDKTKGIGLSLLIWVYFVLIFDGILLLLMYNFSDYPIEKFVLFITFLNPIDLARIMVLMQTQVAALMGYSGAIFEQFFTTYQGLLMAFVILVTWASFPLFFAVRKFGKKDL